MAGAHRNLRHKFVLQESKNNRLRTKLKSSHYPQTCKAIVAIMKQNEFECILVNGSKLHKDSNNLSQVAGSDSLLV